MKFNLSKLPLPVNLRTRLILLVLIAVIPALGLIFYSAAEQRRSVTNSIQAHAFELASYVTAEQERLIGESRQLLVSLAYLSDLNGGDAAGCNTIFNNLLLQNQEYSGFSLVGPHGNIICSATRPGVSGVVADRTFFQQTIQNKRFSFGDFQLDHVTNQYSIDFGYPTFDQAGQLQSVVFAMANIRWINTLTSEIRLPQDTSLLVLDDQGTVLFRYPDAAQWTGQSFQDLPLVKTILSEKNGSIQTLDIDKVDRLFAFTPITVPPNTTMYLSVGISTSAAYAEADQAMLRNLAALGIVTAFALLIAWLGGEFFILRQVKALLKTTQALMEGDFKARTGLPHDSGELNQLANVFDQMMDLLEQRELKRREAEADVQRHNRDLVALNAITSAVSAFLEMPEIVYSLEWQLKVQLGIPAAVIYTYREAGDQFFLEKSWGLPDEMVNQLIQISASAYHYDQVIRQKEVFYRSSVIRIDPYASLGLGSNHPEWRYVCVPLLAKREVLGIIDIFNPFSGEISQNEIELFKAIGQQVGVVMQNARLFEQIRDGRERLRRLSNQVLEAQETERRHISRELHDEIGQSLTALKVNLEAIEQKSGGANSDISLDESIEMIDRAIRQVRAMSLDLRPSLLDDLGVVAAIRWYVDRQAQRAGFKAAFTPDPPEMRLSPEMETTCFRIIQEAITNVVRHAQAQVVNIRLSLRDTQLELAIRDDGIGFDVQAAKEKGEIDTSLGLIGMEERVHLVGGTIEILSNIDGGRGTEIRAVFPIQSAAVAVESQV